MGTYPPRHFYDFSAADAASDDDDPTGGAWLASLIDAARTLDGRLPLPVATNLNVSGDPHLDGRYGDEAAQVRALVEEDSTLGEPLVPGLAYLRAEAVHAVRHEMATTLDDVLSRRTRARLEDRAATLAAAPAVADLMAAEAGWSDERRDGEVATLRASIEAEVAAAG